VTEGEDEAETPGGGAGLPNFGDLLSQLTSTTARLEAAAEEARSTVVQGTSAGGSVVISLSGELQALQVRIDPALVDPSDVPMLEDAVLAALRDALEQIVDLQSEVAEMAESGLGGGGLDLGSMLGSLGGMLGNLGDPEHMPGALGGGLSSMFGSLLGTGPASAGGDADFDDLTDDADFEDFDDDADDDDDDARLADDASAGVAKDRSEQQETGN
jgi:hypothetical protein